MGTGGDEEDLEVEEEDEEDSEEEEVRLEMIVEPVLTNGHNQW